METLTPTKTVYLDVDETASFIAGVKAVATSASTDAARPILGDILIELADNTITLSATNSYMLSIVTLQVSCPGMNESLHVNAKNLVKAMPTGSKNLMGLEVNDESLAIAVDGGLRCLPKEDGEFPNIKGLTTGYDVETDGAGVDFGAASGQFYLAGKLRSETYKFSGSAGM